MEHKKTLGRIIRQFRKLSKQTQPGLAETTGIDQGAISRIENGKQTVTDDQMVAIARALGIHVSELWAAVESTDQVRDEAAVYRAPPPSGFRVVPLIGWVQAGKWTEVADPFAESVSQDVVATAARVSNRAFALEVRGDSMTNPRGTPSFPHGTKIIVDPKVMPENGSLVIAQLEPDVETTFKKLVTDGGATYLMPLNPQFPTLPTDRGVRICGVVVAIAEQSLALPH